LACGRGERCLVLGIRERLRHLERAAEDETVLLRCLECGEELRVREGIELDLVAHEWVEEQERRGRKVYGEAPEDVHLINNHPCNWTALRHKHTGERLFPWGQVPYDEE
jgi:hypothetical protein